MEEKSSKAKGVSIVMILLAIVIGFGFVIGLTQTSGAKNLNNTESEISHYSFDENGVLLSYNGTSTELEIPATYSLSSTSFTGSTLKNAHISFFILSHSVCSISSRLTTNGKVHLK